MVPFSMVLSADGPEKGIPKIGGVCFRFDDNKPIEQWKELAAMFEQHDMRFSMAIIPSARNSWMQPGWMPFLQEMEQKGYEIMDHTPFHRMFAYKPADAEEKELLSKVKSVDHIGKDGTSFFKYIRNKRYPEVIPVTCDISGKTAVPVAQNGKKRFYVYGYLYDPVTGIAWYSVWKKGVFQLRSFWYEDNLDLPERKNVKLELVRNFGGFDLPEDALKLHLDTSRKRFAAMGLKKMPVTFCLPGAYEPHLDAVNVAPVYRKGGYTSGSTNLRPSLWGYGEKNDPERSRFAMSCWDVVPETPAAVKSARHVIANRVALNRVATVGSHMRVNRLPGKWPEYLQHYRELLQWCHENKLQVHVQKDWCRLLYDTKTDPAWNIMPQIDVDRDKDGIPDGYQIFSAAKISGKKLIAAGKGKLFEIFGLCGAESGTNVFSFRYNAKQETVIHISISALTSDRDLLKENQLNAKLVPGENQLFTAEFQVPEKTDMRQITAVNMPLFTAPAELFDFSITGK